MGLRLFDCNANIGLRMSAPLEEPTTVGELLEEMDRLEIDAALVSHYSGFESEPLLGNARLDEEVGGHPRLQRAWTVLPDTGGDMPPASDFIGQLVLSGARAARLYPQKNEWCLDEWCAGALLRALEERKVPTMIPQDQTNLRDLHGVLGRHPALPIILSRASYRQNRMLFPLLEQHSNLYIDLSPTYVVHHGIEALCSRNHAEQLLFGTGYSRCEPGASITHIMYADISEEQRELIAHGNLERLIAGVVE